MSWQDAPRGGTLRLAPGSGDPAAWRRLLPAGVRDVVRGQLDRLSPSAFALVAAGAVLGHDFRFEQLCAVADLPEHEALAALDVALRSRMWREAAAAGTGVFAFAHDMIRAVVYDEAGEPRRRIFHRRALAALQAAGARPAELARHALAAGLVAPAFRFSVAAGDAAIRVFAVRDAIGYYEQAHALLGTPPGATPLPDGLALADVQRLLSGLGRAYEFVNDWPTAEAVYGELLAGARRLGAPETECLALNRLAAVAYQGYFDLRRAGGLLHQALALAEQGVAKPVQVETDWNLAQLNFYMWHLDAALAFAARARPLADELGQRDLAARCLNTMAFSKMMLGHDWRQVVEEAGQARQLFAALGNRAMEADTLSMIAIMQIHGGLFAAGIAAAQEGLSIARAAENPWGQANCAWSLARALYERGEFLAALATAQAGVAAARAAGHPPSLVFNLSVLGRIYATLGDRDAARVAHSEGWQIAATLPPHPLITEWAAAELGADAALDEDWAAAYQYTQRVLVVRDYQTVYAGPGRWYETAALVHAGAADRAAADLVRFDDQLNKLGYSRRYRIHYLRAAAVLAEAQGNLPRALAHLQEAATLARDLGMRAVLWPIKQEMARLAGAQGNDSAAQEHRQGANQLRQALADQITDPQWRATFLAAPQ